MILKSSQNTIQTQEQAIDGSNNSKDTQYNQNSNTTSTICNNNLSTRQITNIWTCQIKNGEIILGIDYLLVRGKFVTKFSMVITEGDDAQKVLDANNYYKN